MDQVEYFDRLNKLNDEIALKDAITRLRSNPDFKLLFTSYVTNQAVSLTLLLGTLENSVTNKDNLVRRLDAIGLFNSFIETAHSAGEAAESDKLDLETENQGTTHE